MMTFDGGWFGWLGLVSMLAGTALLVGVVLVVIWAVQRTSGSPEDEALQVLRARYARGDIDAAQYEATAEMLRVQQPARRRDAVGVIGLVLIAGGIAVWLLAGVLGGGPRNGWERMMGPGMMGSDWAGPGGQGYGPGTGYGPMMGHGPMMGTGPAPTAPVGTSVRMAGTRFDPATLTIRAGETVRWFNDDALPHTVTASDRAWGSGNLNPGASYEHRFDAAGTYAYVCLYHPGMVGTIVVS